MVEVGLTSLPVGAEGVLGVCDCEVGVVIFEELERGGADPDCGGSGRSVFLDFRASLIVCLVCSNVPIVAVDGP